MPLARLDQTTRDNLAKCVKELGYRATYASTGVSPMTLRAALSGRPVTDETRAKLARLPSRTRQASDYVLAGARLQALRARSGAWLWALDTIRGARDAQLTGNFRVAVALAEAMRTDDALFIARRNRTAPQSALETRLVPHDTARGQAVQARALASVTIQRTTLAGIHGTLADHGVAIGYVDHETNEDGTRIDMRLREWPLETVRYDSSREVLTTTARNQPGVIDIVHGDGHWIVFAKTEVKPWTQDACVLPAALIWAAHTSGLSDWASATRSHGLPRVMGELPPEVPLMADDGTLDPRADTFLTMLINMVSGEAGAGIRPAGSKTEFEVNSSSAWQIFTELTSNREKAAARVYLGTDAILGSVGGAPGVDIAALFSVASTILQSDLQAIEDGLNSGLLVPWTAINYGDSRLAPSFKYQLPDTDSDAIRSQKAAARARVCEAVAAMREQKLEVTQEVVDQLAAEQGVSPAPALASIEAQTSTIVLAPTDVAKVVRVSEARAAQGLPPFGDTRDNMTLTELDESIKAKAAANLAQAQAAADATVKAAPEAPTAAPVI